MIAIRCGPSKTLPPNRQKVTALAHSTPTSPGQQDLWRSLRQLLERLSAGALNDLLVSSTHAPYLTRHRISALIARIRLVALGFSGFTLLWIPLDAMTLPDGQWQALAVARLVSVAIFLALAFATEREHSLRQALAMLAGLLAMPLLLYGMAQWLLGSASVTGLAAINVRLYQALPFIVLAGLCIFPLVLVEGLLFALAVLGTVAFVQVSTQGFNGVELLSTLWVLALALGVYLLACATQLHYMMALLHRASYDPLTGAMTRRSGVEVIELQFRLAVDQDAPLAIAFLDLDKFKSINDDHGHEAGDAALRSAAQSLHELLRQADVVIRWGGEEFVVVLTNTDANGLRIVMQRILNDWLGTRPDGRPLTASIGVAERKTDGAGDWTQLVALADERMYRAKESGRARCVLDSDTMMLPAS